MFDVFIYSRILGSWDRLGSAHTLDAAQSIASPYRRGFYASDPAWVQIRRGGDVVFDSIRDAVRS